MKMKLKHLKNKKGVSMIIALALLSVIMVMSLNSSDILVNAIRGNIDLGNSYKAEAAMDSGIEFGLYAAKNVGIGQNVEGKTFCITNGVASEIADLNDTCNSSAFTYSITNTAEPINGDSDANIYTLPPPGTGDAGQHCEYETNYTAYTNDDAQMKPCNWNKIRFGETVTVPLYYTDENGDTISPYQMNNGSGMGKFIFRVRTPCKNTSTQKYAVATNPNNPDLLAGDTEADWCPSGSYERPDLANPSGQSNNDIIVHWQIIGNCEYTFNIGEVENQVCVGLPVQNGEEGSNDWDSGSTIDFYTINAAKEGLNRIYKVLFPYKNKGQVDDLNSDNDDPYGNANSDSINNYLNEQDNSAVLTQGMHSRKMNTPILQFAVVSPLKENATTSVPYVEYQLETDVPIASSHHVVTATGIMGNYRLSRTVKKEVNSSNIDFVFQN